MARKRPDPLSRRHLVEADLSPAEALAIADGYLAEERVVDALPFLEKAGARERLEALRDAAIEAGDGFSMREIERALGDEPDGDAWNRLADAAEAAGKERYAVEARRMAAARGG